MQDSQSVNLDRALGFLRRRGLLILACAALAALAAFAISKSQQKMYTATASVAFNESQLSQEIAGLPTAPTNTLLQNASNLEMLDLGNLAAKTAAEVGHGLTERDVEEAVSIGGSTESTIASVSATDASATLAARMANVYARKFVKAQSRAKSNYFNSALKLVRQQIQAIPSDQREGVAAVDLLARAHSLALLSRLQPSTVEVAQVAVPPAGPSSPTTKKNTLIGLIFGLLLGFGIALLLERIDSRIRDPREMASVYGTRLLGTVPRSSDLAAYRLPSGSEGMPEEAEAFQVIRTHLSAFNGGAPPKSILVSSAAATEGKSTVAFYLAWAAAQAGARVLLLEANFRRPSLAQRLDLGDSPTLVEMVTGHSGVDPIARIPLGADSAAGSLGVLPAGQLGSRVPAAVIGSQAMDLFLEGIRASYDLIVVDGPDLIGVSDALALAKKVDGLVIVGLSGRTQRDVADDLALRLCGAEITVQGVVVDAAGGGRRRPGRKSREKGEEAFGATGATGSESRLSDTELAPNIRVEG